MAEKETPKGRCVPEYGCRSEERPGTSRHGGRKRAAMRNTVFSSATRSGFRRSWPRHSPDRIWWRPFRDRSNQTSYCLPKHLREGVVGGSKCSFFPLERDVGVALSDCVIVLLAACVAYALASAIIAAVSVAAVFKDVVSRCDGDVAVSGLEVAECRRLVRAYPRSHPEPATICFCSKKISTEGYHFSTSLRLPSNNS
ncbi:unnamed protein product [Scytosiphon promiscuus]